MAKKEMTRRQLMAACRASDRRNRQDRHDDMRKLAAVMSKSKCDPFAWELEELKRLVHGIYGRALAG